MMSHAIGSPLNKSSAPLWTWITAGALALIFLAVSYFWFFRADSFQHFNPQRLESFACRDGQNTLRIAVIGTSLTANALYKDDVMENFAKARGTKISFLRFTLSGGSLNEFYDLSKAAINSDADIIFFEAATFGLDMGNSEVKVLLDRYRYYIRHGGTKLLSLLPFVTKRNHLERNNENYTNIELTHNPDFLQNLEKETGLYLKRIPQFRIRDFSEGEKFFPLFRLARARGKVVVFIDLSRSKDAWDMLPAGFDVEFTQTLKEYEKNFGISYLKFPQRLPLDCFQDFAHFGPKGKKLYSEWFLASLALLPRDAGK